MNQTINAHTNPFFKQLYKLEKSARYRKKMMLTLLDGLHLVQAYHAALGIPETLIISQSNNVSQEIKDFLDTLKNSIYKPRIVTLNDTLFQHVSPVKSPTGIMAVVTIPKPSAKDKAQQVFSVLLEAIQDPGNLGSILRTAAAAGVSDVYLSSECADAWSPKTLRAAMGAHFQLAIHEQSNLLETAQQFDGQVIATTPHGEKSLYQLKLTTPTAFVFGNEGTGLSNELLQATDTEISIPMPGETESLNAAAAAAVCLFERVRQQAQLHKPSKSPT